MSRERVVNRRVNPLLEGLPAKFQSIQPHQIDAVTQIMEGFDNGAKVVVVDAPTGTGKTLIAEVVRLMLGVKGAYVCHSKQLQDQFCRDFDYAGVLYGKANYQPDLALDTDVTCEDCEGKDCTLCSMYFHCPYQEAKRGAVASSVAVVNSALWLAAMNGEHWLKRRGLTVFDEADTLEGVMMGQVEVVVSPRAQERYGITPPAQMTVSRGYGEWAEGALEKLERAKGKVVRGKGDPIKAAREVRRLKGLQDNILWLKGDLEEGREWVYTGGAGSAKRAGNYISFKPVKVESVGRKLIWPNGERFLLMSGSVISAGMMLRGLGWDGSEGWTEVTVESQFHAKNRGVVVRGVADMTKKGQESNGSGAVIDGCRRILDAHPNERVVVHTVSYRLAQEISAGLGGRVIECPRGGGREAVSRFAASEGSVLVGPVFDRGIDLPDELCRAQIIAKVPFPYLGDKQVSARLYGDGVDGKIWYNVEVARTLLQMVGRGVRHEGDYCTTYILDSHFLKWYERWGHLFPKWWRKAVRVEV